MPCAPTAIDLEKKLWTSADKLRSNLDAAVYKHIALGLLFLKYVSDAFEERQKELDAQFRDPAHDYYMDPADYPDDYEGNVAAEREVRDYYTEKNVFWVPVEARWQTLVNCAQLPPKAPLPWNKPGKDELEEMRSVGWLIDPGSVHPASWRLACHQDACADIGLQNRPRPQGQVARTKGAGADVREQRLQPRHRGGRRVLGKATRRGHHGIVLAPGTPAGMDIPART